MYRLQIAFDDKEREALITLAHAERRTIRQQIERLMREGLERRKLIESVEAQHDEATMA
jgi:hypothetical protein